MNVSEIDPWYAPLSPPTISDAELNALGESNARLGAELLLRYKRAPSVWHDLDRMGVWLDGKIADLNDPDIGHDLGNHIESGALLKRWKNLKLVIDAQKAWHLRQVVVDKDEVYALVTRWLMLKYGDHGKPRDQGVPV